MLLKKKSSNTLRRSFHNILCMIYHHLSLNLPQRHPNTTPILAADIIFENISMMVTSLLKPSMVSQFNSNEIQTPHQVFWAPLGSVLSIPWIYLWIVSHFSLSLIQRVTLPCYSVCSGILFTNLTLLSAQMLLAPKALP